MRDRRISARALQVFQASGLPKGLSVRAAADAQPAEILLYDEIGYWGVTAKDFLSAMAQAGAGPLRVRINSPGGDVFDGLAIYNALKAHPGGVTTQVDGLAASAASFIALAGTRVEMGEQAMMMIHDAWGVAVGNKNDMRETAGLLDKVDGQLAAIYAGKTGKPVADIAASMDAETWMTSQEAVDAGYADGISISSFENSVNKPKAMLRPALRAALRAAYDPDGDGDDDAAEAVQSIQNAIQHLANAIGALTPPGGNDEGGDDADPGDDDTAAQAALRQKINTRLRIALAE